MTPLRFRDAGPETPLRWPSSARRSFTETFGHLYTPENLSAFLQTHNQADWAAQLTDPAYAIRVAEADSGLAAYAKLGPPSLPFEPRGAAIELRQFYILKPWHGTGAAAELMDWAIAEAIRRGADDLYLSYSSTIIAPAASTRVTASSSSGYMRSWSAIMPTRIMSCACR
jgi:GNAT superfamily N-acetyltransferase